MAMLAYSDRSVYLSVGQIVKIVHCGQTRDVHWNGMPMGIGIKHRIGNGNWREWETTSMGTRITCIQVGIYSHSFLLRLTY